MLNTILIPTFNRHITLNRAVLAALKQKDSQVWILNDGGAISDEYERMGVRVINTGRADNSGLSIADGLLRVDTEYASICYDDDWYEPNFVDCCLSYMMQDTNKDISFIITQGKIQFEDGKSRLNIASEMGTGIIHKDVFIEGQKKGPLTITPACCLFRTNDLREAWFVNAFPGLPRSKAAVVGHECLAIMLVASKYKYVVYDANPLVNFGAGKESTTIAQYDSLEFRELYKQSKKIFDVIT